MPNRSNLLQFKPIKEVIALSEIDLCSNGYSLCEWGSTRLCTGVIDISARQFYDGVNSIEGYIRLPDPRIVPTEVTPIHPLYTPIQTRDNIMAFLVSLGQTLLLTTILFHHAASCPPQWDSNQADLEGVIRNEISRSNTQSLFARNYVNALVEARLRHSRRSSPQTRQLGDIEFSNRYAESLRSKAKHTSICTLLRRMQTVSKSGFEGDKVNLLMKQYMCHT
ncbi:hypothetical protein DPEC_G00214750 [Dallia pectoralis]|uniref:Uncharacterized protein n=1 Tax=Dallia pectoralis TaxID=75939 RepID=A0ACC2G2B5_DALPE|nr:hypothetical protein DPEC_G00214750 [Dallia pectoralis]